jgi:hypothetical protein
MMKFYNMILIAGAGRNVGKTNLACELIRHFSSALEVVGIKISPHFHQKSHENELVNQSDKFIISKEIHTESQKDSSRMLKAGAHKVYFIEADDKYVSDAFRVVASEIDSRPIICESAALRKFVHPGIFIFIDKNLTPGNSKHEDQKEKADFIVHTFENSFNFRNIQFDGKRWKLPGKER